MNVFDLLQKWPSWEKAGAEAIFDSPAWAMPVRWGDAPCILRRAEGKVRDVLGIDIRFDDEDNFIGLGNRESFPDLHVLWDVKNNLPDSLKLALVEKECGPLFQILENAVRRQLSVVGVAPAEKREGTTGFEIIDGNGGIVASFDMRMTTDMIRTLGLMRFLDVNHETIRSMTRTAYAVYASFSLTETERASLAPGDYLLLTDMKAVLPRWQTEIPADSKIRVMAPESTELSFAQYADDALPEVPKPNMLALHYQGKVIANGRLGALVGNPAMAIEEVL